MMRCTKTSPLFSCWLPTIELAELNLRAGEKALASSAFHSGSKYFLAGLALLGSDTWDIKYDLTMKLYDAGMSFWY